MSIKQKKVCTTLNYIQYFLILGSTITGFISVFVFSSLTGIPKEITSFAMGLKICAIASGIKTYKFIIKKKQKEA